MKTLDTLVEDIYGLFTTDFKPSEDDVARFGLLLSRRISGRIAEERAKPSLRLSNLGTPCERKLWYSINSPEDAEPLPPEARLKFLYGDILEELLLFLAAQAGHTVEGEQDAIFVEGVEGHRDAIVDGVTLDVKSASSYSFAKFADHLTPDNDAFGYLTQLDTYIEGGKDDPRVLEKSLGGFLVVDKTLGKICLDRHKRNGVEYNKVVEAKRAMLASPTPPPRAFPVEPFGKSGNMKLGVQCSYCDFKKKCRPETRCFAYSTGPVYLTKVVRPPDVPEINIGK